MDAERAGPEERGETRLAAAVAVIGAIVLYAALPNQLLIGPRYVVPGLEMALFVPLMLANPRRMSKQNRHLRRLSIALVLLIAASQDYLFWVVGSGAAAHALDHRGRDDDASG